MISNGRQATVYARPPSRGDAARHSVLRWTVLRLGSRASADCVETFATRLTDNDRSRSLVAPGTQHGFFRVVYRFENEQLVEK